jgi:hypothetical protein
MGGGACCRSCRRKDWKRSCRALVVLRGERRGERATLLDARPEAGVAAVQLADDLSVLRLSLDDFAEVASGGGGLVGGGAG